MFDCEIEGPTPEVLRETARYQVHSIDLHIREGVSMIQHFEDELRKARCRVVRLRNSRAQWAQLLKD